MLQHCWHAICLEPPCCSARGHDCRVMMVPGHRWRRNGAGRRESCGALQFRRQRSSRSGGGAVLPPPAADLFSSFHPALDLLQKLESLVKEYGSADKAAALAGEQRWPLFMCPHLAPGACPGATLSLAELLSGQLPLPQMAPPTAP